MKNTCKYCKYYSTEYFLGGYASPICSLYGMLEEVGNPHHDLDATKCKDFTIKLTPFPDLNIPSEKYRWYKENEEEIKAFFMECFEEWFKEYISQLSNIENVDFSILNR